MTDSVETGAATAAVPNGQFSDGKDPGALRTIGEVARALGLRQHVLRYWEDQFPMLRPLTRAGGRRYYRPDDIALLRRIDQLVHHQGFTIRGARLALVQLERTKPGAKRSAVALPEVVHGAVASDSDEPAVAILAAMVALRAHLDAIRLRLSAALSDS